LEKVECGRGKGEEGVEGLTIGKRAVWSKKRIKGDRRATGRKGGGEGVGGNQKGERTIIGNLEKR